GRNLIFVDEGHKGKRSEEQKWAKLRNELGKNGFVIEYSATFGQILDEKNKDILNEYAKSIIYDYSYKYFYLDGYGKDFTVLNIKQRPKLTDKEFQEAMFVANLLSYYEQLLCYERYHQIAKEHNIEKPLWIFVGTTVTGREEESDVLQIIDFLRKTISEEDWLKETVQSILAGHYKDAEGRDIFKERFPFLRQFLPIDYEDLYKRVFDGRGNLNIYEIKNAEGELGLKVGEGAYFGVVNIGDVGRFKKQLEEKGFDVGQDAISQSLFDDIKRENSTINILIGSKKFIEGWDTWRVSSMGLLNMGKGQGPQIIQLFGRGVRIKGKNLSLKRSEDNKLETKILETLNIYSIRADYLQNFLKALQKEEVEYETIHIPVKPRHQEKWKELYVPTLKEGTRESFLETAPLPLLIDDRISLTIDLTPKIFEAGKERREIRGEEMRARAVEPQSIPHQELLDWERIFREMCNFKIERGYFNLYFRKEDLQAILCSVRYKILATEDLEKINSLDDLTRLEDLAILVLKKYVDAYYKRKIREHELNNVKCDTVEAKQLPLFAFERGANEYAYEVQVEKARVELVEKIKKLADDLEQLFK
ncbi:MAG: restriction endonuclease subunit R, partial [bacterium]